ncbi:MAG TPA: hypothetical protein VGK41_05535 [Solirubrobacterales bacterium]
MPDPNGTPTRIPDFYDRRYSAVTEVDRLDCRECHKTQTLEHDEVPDPGTLIACPECGLESRVPALPSQAGMAEPIDPPPHNERS